MPNPRYEAGRAYEYKVMNRLKAEGYICMRSAGSHGHFDVIAIKPGNLTAFTRTYDKGFRVPGEIKLIQCKTGVTAKRARDKVVMSKLAENFDGLYQVKVEVV